MSRLPKMLVSSVIRGAQQGDSHGGLFIVDIENARADLRLDWNRTDIDTSGRGGDRGLRGVGFYGEHVVVAANAAILLLDQGFECIATFTNRYLGHCHEISIHGEHLFVASTGYDSILVFNLREWRFTHGFHLALDDSALKLRAFDPQDPVGPSPSRQFHLNTVKATAAGFCISGLRTPGLLHTDGRNVSLLGRLPMGTHNAQQLDGRLLYNDTASDCIRYHGIEATRVMAVPHFRHEDIINIERLGSDVARPGFARGLCVVSPDVIAGGSSPSTISLYELTGGTRIAMQNISMDVRNAVHGLAVWPY